MTSASRDPALRPAGRLALALVLAFGLPAAAAQAQVPEPESQMVEISQPSAISEQYHEIEDVVADAVDEVAPPAAPAPAAAAPAPPPAAPEPVVEVAEPTVSPAPPTGEEQQYHSEPNVSQSQPSNVNVSVRILSPGDDGPVVQVNGAGAVDVQVDAPAPTPRAPRAPAPDAAAGPPGDWDWEWTSACFGGALAAAAAAGAPEGGWSWRWSCAADEEELAESPLPDVVPALDVVEAVMPGAPQSVAPAPPRPAVREREPRRERRASVDAPARPRERPAPTLVVATAAAAEPATGAQLAPAERSRRPHRAAPAARDRASAATLDFPLGAGGGHAAGPANGLGTASSLLLGSWLAVLASLLALVVPRLRRRRWSGHVRPVPESDGTRLERPG